MRGWEKIADSRFSDQWILRVHVKISQAKIISVFPSKSVYRGESVKYPYGSIINWGEMR